MTDEYEKENWCAHEDKKCYSKADAQQVINFCTAKHHKQRQKNIPKRAYFCEYCNSYHLTHVINEFTTPNKERKRRRREFEKDKIKTKQQLKNYNSEE